jgi:outer membrane receptor protein involved in Fe transport
MKRIITGIVLIIVLMSNIQAQQKGGMIKGILIDSQTDSPVEFASVTLHNPKDSTAVKGCASGKTGEFILSGIPVGKYFLKVSYIGYEKKYVQNIAINNNKSEIDLGKVKLSQTGVDIQGAEVTAQRPDVEFKIDKKVINVSQNLQSTSGTALDVLKTQPSVQVDQNDNVTLRGSSSFTVLVDGRPSPIQGSDALRQIPANIVENIEIITNPSAKYEAEGAAGIINIVTKKIAEGTFSGMVNTGAGTRDKYNGDFTINYREKAYAVSAGLDFLKRYDFFNQDLTRETFLTGSSINNITSIEGNVLRDNLTGRIGLDYNFSDNTGITLNLSGGKMNVERSMTSAMQNTDGLINLYTFTDDKMNADSKFFSGSFFFTHKFQPKVSELSFEATYNRVNSPSTQNTGEYVTDASYKNRAANPGLREFTDDTKRSDGRIKLDYSHTFSSKSKLEAGTQFNYYFRKFDTQNEIFDWNANTWVTTVNYTNRFDYRNNVYAAYATYTNEIWDLTFQAGLRSEYTDRLLEQKTLSNEFSFKKLDFFPSFNLQKKFGMLQTLQFSFTRRINRPNELLLNPYPFFSSSYTNSAGNPNLKPEYTNSYELNYQNFFSGIYLTVETYLRTSKDTPSQAVFVDNQGKMTTTYENFAKTNTFGADITASYSPVTWLTLRPSFSMSNLSYDGTLLGKQVKYDAFNWRTVFFSTISFSSNTSLQLIAVYLGKISQPLMDIKPTTFLIASFRQMLFDKKITLTISGQNLFNVAKFNVNNAADNYRNKFLIKPESNTINLTITYNFNNFKDLSHKAEKVDVGVSQGIQ